MENAILLDQYSCSRSAIIEPSMQVAPIPDFPETVIAVFSYRLFDAVLASLGGREIAAVHNANGLQAIYEVFYEGCRFAFTQARVGAPACVANFEDVIAMGAKRILLLGSCGVLERAIADCSIIIPTAALRDEGTSYHYVPSLDAIRVNLRYRELFTALLDELACPYVQGTTWTTDAPYRETREKMERRRAQGAIVVEMECAAMQAMCDFRGVEFFQYLYAADNLDAVQWERRSLSGGDRLSDKEKIALLAFELGRRIQEEQHERA